jgi:tyrosinase
VATINSDVWVSRGIAEDDGSFTITPGAPVDENTGLTPFWNAQTTFWSSAIVQDTIKAGYTYPDFNGLAPGNTDAIRTAIANRINQLYGSTVFGSNFRSFAAVPPSSPASIRSVADTAKKVPVTLLSHKSLLLPSTYAIDSPPPDSPNSAPQDGIQVFHNPNKRL